jgi:hypothetical protein
MFVFFCPPRLGSVCSTFRSGMLAALLMLLASTPCADAQLASSIQTMLHQQRQGRTSSGPSVSSARVHAPSGRAGASESSPAPRIGNTDSSPLMERFSSPGPSTFRPTIGRAHTSNYRPSRAASSGSLAPSRSIPLTRDDLSNRPAPSREQGTVRVYWAPQLVKVWEPYLTHSLNPFSKPRTRYRLVEKTVLRPYREVIPDRWSRPQRPSVATRPDSRVPPSGGLRRAAELAIPLSKRADPSTDTDPFRR